MTPAAFELSDLSPRIGAGKVSLIIPTYNRNHILSDTVAMALNQDYPDFEVIVVDQSESTTKETLTLIQEAPGRVRYLRLPHPNLPAARNAGVRAATGEIIVFIDDDVVIEPDYLAAQVRLYRDPSVGGVMGLTFDPGEAEDPEMIACKLNSFDTKRRLSDGVVQVGRLIGGNTSYRATALRKAGMSDERFTGSGWFEDYDLSVRVEHTGHRLLMDPRIRMRHLALPSGGCGNRQAMNEELKQEERCRLYLFFCLKNRRIFGLRQVLANIWTKYRAYSMNRHVAKSPKKLIQRHCAFARCAVRAIGMCREAYGTS